MFDGLIEIPAMVFRIPQNEECTLKPAVLVIQKEGKEAEGKKISLLEEAGK